MSSNPHHEPSSRPRPPITIVSTEQGPRVGPYIFGKTLGTGSTGKVKLAKNLVTGDIVAIKIVRKDYLDNKPSLKKKMRREISVLKVLNHQNLMSLIDVFEIDTHLFLVMEYVDGFELFEYLVRRGALAIPQALGFFQQIICGLEYCHNRLICHRDLKPENLLLDRNSLNIKIADFGMTSLSLPDNLLETSCGSPHYCDPMVVSGEMYDGRKADIWSCGVILYAMVTGRLPFDDDNIQRLLQKVQMGQYHLPSDLPKDLKDLIKRMLTVDPDHRIDLKGIKEHPWFKSIPPRNYEEDNFVASVEPTLNPDPLILRSLVDLGWGDTNSITEKLASPGASMIKVFYGQLEQHPMYRRSTLHRAQNTPQSGNNGHGHRRSGSNTQPHQEQRPKPHDDSNKAANADTSNGNAPHHHKNANGASDSNSNNASSVEESVRSKLENLEVNDSNRTQEKPSSSGEQASNGEHSDLNGVPYDVVHSSARVVKTGETEVNLVRQSSLRDMTSTSVEEQREDIEEEAINSVAGQHKSWFDSMRTFLSPNMDNNNNNNNNNNNASDSQSQRNEDNHASSA